MKTLLDKLVELKASQTDPAKGLKVLKNEIFSNLSVQEKNHLALFLVIKFSCLDQGDEEEPSKVSEAQVEESEKVDDKLEHEEKEEPADEVLDLPNQLLVNQSDLKKESDWVTSSSQVAEVINTSDYKSEVVVNTGFHFKEPSVHEPSSS